MSNIRFVETLLCPYEIKIENNLARTAVNSVAIVTGKQWQEVVKSLVAQAHKRANLPTYHTCITDMLRENGFMPLNEQIYNNIESLFEQCEKISNGKTGIIVKSGYSGYYALIPDGNNGYLLKGHKAISSPYIANCFFNEVWIYHEGFDFKTGIYKKSNKHRNIQNTSDKLTFANMNPENKYIGDCVIRGLSAAYGCTWHEAIDCIAEALNYTDPVLNTVPNINITLIKLGFERHREIKRGGKLLNGEQFCDLMNYTYHHGEKIFAYVGKSHCAAILPFNKDGVIKYKIQDTWDSTSRLIHEYWVYSEKKSKEVEPTKNDIKTFNINDTIIHPSFGKGIIISEYKSGNSKIFEIHFEKTGAKKISEEWLKNLPIYKIMNPPFG